ncbi:probable serine carboxypeptidase CPVL isoform X2 [Mercenaria mercenaria]|uniref:probable serine carboxypeptidase CPVL isoform X2 n=1 Tax=Mercenaria mercenaria TaxID=6596 RepID=UPI00234F1081|nr:probable serine carboxypeptidase CPVL isoform X2 [Mercenaria mercenaria]
MTGSLLYTVCLLTIACHEGFGKSALRGMFPDKYPPMKQNGVDPGQPVFLTPYIEQGQFKQAMEASKVGPIEGVDQTSYAGFITVNKTYNSNMYFWFFPAQNKPESAPVLVWLQGGPGGSSLFGLFVENGPYLVNKDIKFVKKDITWNSKYSMLYIDNPVGTGFSFTDKDEGYARNEVDVARDLYSCLTQFFQVFNQLQNNSFFVTGESYAGKYVPAISYKIHEENKQLFPKVRINLQGLAIGDGLCDPETMMIQYADFMYNIGMLDEEQRDYFQGYAKTAVQYIQKKEFGKAFDIFDMLILGGPGSFVGNVTMAEDYYNFLRTKAPADFDYYGTALADPEIRKAIHVGNLTYHAGTEVEKHIINDIMDTVKPWVATLMDNYRVMMYTGQLDIIVAIPLTEAFLMTVPWSGLEQYKAAGRLVWRIHSNDTEVAGYVRNVNNFYQVIVRGGGHILPYDQPARSFDMIDRFINDKGFA